MIKYVGLLIALSTVVSSQFPLPFNVNPDRCSFIDSLTGYSVIWHTNCTGYVNFVLNFRNFPIVGNFWTGIGFNLLSNELVLAEVMNGNVDVSTATIYSNQPPHRSQNRFLVNPRGAIFSKNILEVTFSIHESILTGCKEWTFYNVPTPIGNEFINQPPSRTVCNVSQTCSRIPCEPNSHLLQDQYYPLNNFNNIDGNQFRPQRVLYDSNSFYTDPYYNQLFDNQQELSMANDRTACASCFYDPNSWILLLQQQPQPYYGYNQYNGVTNPNYQYYPYGRQYNNRYYLPNAVAPKLSYLLTQATTKRRKRSIGNDILRRRGFDTYYPPQNVNYDSLAGTAYEGQDRQYKTFWNDQWKMNSNYWPFAMQYDRNYENQRRQLDEHFRRQNYYNDNPRYNYPLNEDPFNRWRWRLKDNNSPLYYPYRTIAGNNYYNK